MPIGLTEAAAIAAISGVIITGANKLSNHYDNETAFERMRQNMDKAARNSPRVVKIQGRYWFFHKDDFKRETGPGGVPLPKDKKDQFNQKRRVSFKPNDGWYSNNWIVNKKFEIPGNGGKLVKKTYSISNEECAEFFSEKYFEGGMVKRKPGPRDTIEGVA